MAATWVIWVVPRRDVVIAAVRNVEHLSWCVMPINGGRIEREVAINDNIWGRRKKGWRIEGSK